MRDDDRKRPETPLEQEMRLRFTEGAEKRNATPEAATARASNLRTVGKRPDWLDAISDDLDRKDRAKLQPGGVVRFPPLASQEDLDRDDNRGSFMLGLVLILLGAGYGAIIGALILWLVIR